MKKCIAFYRGINVGGKNRLPMKDLVSAMQDAGAMDVQTYIQSGNAVYSGTPGEAEKAAALIEDRHGFKPGVCVLSARELRHVLDENPFPEAEGKSCHFNFCERMPDAVDEQRLEKLRKESERYALRGKVFYFHAPEGIGRSKLAAQAERCLGVTTTGRNLNMVLRTLALAEG